MIFSLLQASIASIKNTIFAVSFTPFRRFTNYRTHTRTKKRRLHYCSSTHKGLSTYPQKSINNNETYADMTNPRKCTRYEVRCTKGL